MIEVEHANWAAPSNVKACTTLVTGGVSQGIYKGLNLGAHVGDCVEDVHKNRKLVFEELGFPNQPYWLNQVHGVTVIRAQNMLQSIEGSLLAEGSSTTPPDADGAFTFSKGVVCAILTADCMPVFLTTRSGDRVALLHAGWRGLADGIIEYGVNALDCPADQVLAWVGPSIGPNAFEIGDEVRQQLGGSDSAYTYSDNSTQANKKWFANLYQLAGERFKQLGVHEYSHSQACTFSDQRFYSYRRSGQCGRMASFIWFE